MSNFLVTYGPDETDNHLCIDCKDKEDAKRKYDELRQRGWRRVTIWYNGYIYKRNEL